MVKDLKKILKMSNGNPKEQKQNLNKAVPGLSGDQIEKYSSLTNAIRATALSFLLLAVTQLLSHCSNVQLENQKRESELIKQALAPDNQQADNNLKFLVKSGLINCHSLSGESSLSLLGKKLKRFFLQVNPNQFEEQEEDKCIILKALKESPPGGFGSNLPSEKSVAAKSLEYEGLTALINGDLPTAKRQFSLAYTIYPTYHSVDEIQELLEEQENEDNGLKIAQCVIAYFDTEQLT